MSICIKTISLCLLAIALVSCVAIKDGSEGSVYTSNSQGFEVETLKEQIDEELAKFPTKFLVPVPDGKASLERAIFFFRTYTSSFTPTHPSATARTITITNEKSGDPGLYRVVRTLTKDGFRYTVSASARKKGISSELMAANLARFIRDSKLEGELLGK